jgi:hypothetical protein
MFKYYFIKNAPENNEELRKYTDELVYQWVNYKLNDSLKNIIFFFFTEKKLESFVFQ